jgi:dTDP-4-dehydrorhamnose 3,5-epimerase
MSDFWRNQPLAALASTILLQVPTIQLMPLTVKNLAISGVLLIEPEIHRDQRGHFFEAWNDIDFREAVGEVATFVQDNQSRSRTGVIRGLHYQLPNPQGKLVRVIKGEAFVVAVDIRRSSPTFGRWVKETLTGDNHRQLWIPPGFAHGFMALADPTDMIYKVTAFYAPGYDRSIRWDDPAIGVDWPETGSKPLMSDKDRAAPLLSDAEVFN